MVSSFATEHDDDQQKNTRPHFPTILNINRFDAVVFHCEQMAQQSCCFEWRKKTTTNTKPCLDETQFKYIFQMVFYRDFLLIFPSFQFLRLDVSFLCPVFLCSVSLCVCVSLSFVLFALQAQKYCSKSPFDGHISDNNNNYSFSNYIFCVCLSFLFLFNCCTIVRHRFAFSIIPFEMASVGISVIRTNNTKWRRVECHIQLQDFNDMI